MIDPLKKRDVEVTNLQGNEGRLEDFVSRIDGLYSAKAKENHVELSYNLLGTSLRDIVGKMKDMGYDIPENKKLGILYTAEDVEISYLKSSSPCSACGAGCCEY